MSNAEGEKRRLTPDDPVPSEQIMQFAEIAEARASIANQLLRLEQDKIYLLASAKQLDDQHKRLFQAVLTERGLSPSTRAHLDVESGKITVEEQPSQPQEPPEAPPEAPPAEA